MGRQKHNAFADTVEGIKHKQKSKVINYLSLCKNICLLTNGTKF